MNLEPIVAIGALLISALGLLLSLYISRRAWRVSVTQYKLALFDSHQTYKKSLTEWASEVLDTFSDSLILCELDPKKYSNFFHERNRLRSKYFSQIDSGRFFYENDGKEGYGQWNEGAFQGIAPEAISILKNALSLVENLNYVEKASNAENRQPLVDLKRDFVTIVQQTVEPKSTMIELKSFDQNNT